ASDDRGSIIGHYSMITIRLRHDAPTGVEPPLQNMHRRGLVDPLPPLLGAHPGGLKGLGSRHGGHAFVDEPYRQLRKLLTKVLIKIQSCCGARSVVASQRHRTTAD